MKITPEELNLLTEVLSQNNQDIDNKLVFKHKI
jgi:hypothetical protein